ncbi:hypothetical protein ACA910_003703 [Epithemia clementina (nom. ined.)]
MATPPPTTTPTTQSSSQSTLSESFESSQQPQNQPQQQQQQRQRQRQQQQQQQQQQQRAAAVVVHLIASPATLLSGELDECLHPDDPTCHGGLAAVAALARAYSRRRSSSGRRRGRRRRRDEETITTTTNATDKDHEDANHDPVLLLPFLDSRTPFVQMSSLGWSVNQFVYQYLINHNNNHNDNDNKNDNDNDNDDNNNSNTNINNHHQRMIKAFCAPPSLLLQNKGDSDGVSQRDISNLQSATVPLLLSNVQVPLANSWNPYHTPVLLDADTGLAVLVLFNSNQALNTPHIATASAGLTYIARRNREAGCDDDTIHNDEQQPSVTFYVSPFESYIDNAQEIFAQYNLTLIDAPDNNTTNTTTQSSNGRTCWIPVILYADVQESLDPLLEAVLAHSHPPALILDVEENAPPFNSPRLLPHSSSRSRHSNTTTNTTTTTAATATWFLSVGLDENLYHHSVLTLSDDRKRIDHVELIFHDLNVSLADDVVVDDDDDNDNNLDMPHPVRDAMYDATVTTLALLAHEARIHDPIVAYSASEMPVQRQGNYRRCHAGPCESAALYLDALQWSTGADLAVGNSGGYRGDGWPAGPIRVSNLWNLLPFPNTPCTGIMTGVSLFQLFNYSLAMATFQGQNTDTGDLLLQVSSGMRITYNTELDLSGKGSSSRLIQIEIWNAQEKAYRPVERLQLYQFATDSFMCTAHPQFRDYFQATRLVFPGEQAGQLDTSRIQQEVVAEYLQALYYNDNDDDSSEQKNVTYVPTAQGRMFNDTTAQTVLNLVQDESSCTEEEYWNAKQFTCVPCPTAQSSGIVFLKESLHFEGQVVSKTTTTTTTTTNNPSSQTIGLVNSMSRNATVISRSLPVWIQIISSNNKTVSMDSLSNNNNNKLSQENIAFVEHLEAGEEVLLDVSVDFASLEAGTVSGTAIFGLLSNEDEDFEVVSACPRPDATFELTVRVKNPERLNQLGTIRNFGFAASAIVIVTSLLLIAWVVWHRKTRVVRTLQPLFLVTITFGVLVMGSALIPLSLDDEIVSVDACGGACMAFPWLLSMGFTVAMSALFSKLWRINKLFHNPVLRRVTVTEKDVMAPFAFLFIVNFAALLVWTLVDPLQWQREVIHGDSGGGGPSNESVGACRATNGPVSTAMIVVVGVVNVSAFAVACYQAFRARNVSDEFSESKSLGVALCSWVQLFMIGVPVLFLIESNNPSARYFITAGLTFAVCMSMLLPIYIPIFIHWKQQTKQQQRQQQLQQQRSIGVGRQNQQNSTVLSSSQRQHVALSASLPLANDILSTASLRMSELEDGPSTPFSSSIAALSSSFMAPSCSFSTTTTSSKHFSINNIGTTRISWGDTPVPAAPTAATTMNALVHPSTGDTDQHQTTTTTHPPKEQLPSLNEVSSESGFSVPVVGTGDEDEECSSEVFDGEAKLSI